MLANARTRRRPPRLRRSWLFLPGADAGAHAAADSSGADVLIQELEDFTPPERRPEARARAPELYDQWRRLGFLSAVRINPLEGEGKADLAAVMRGHPEIVLISKVFDPDQVRALDRLVTAHEETCGIMPGLTELVPNVETAAGLVRTIEIARASPRVTACLVASEDMAADLGTERSRDGAELAYVRSRFLVDCTAAGVVAIDCPYTFSDAEGVEAEARAARRLGYLAKGVVAIPHAAIVNGALSPSRDDVARAERVVAAFDMARWRGEDRAEIDGALVEVPTYHGAKRLLERAQALAEFDRAAR